MPAISAERSSEYRALPQSAGAMTLAVIVDKGRIARWQSEALKAAGIERIGLLLDCRNTAPGPRRIAHAAYYALNLLAIRNPLSRTIAFEETGIEVGERIAFTAIEDGAWQALPPDVLNKLRERPPQAIIKFGMGLLRIPPPKVLPVPILSFHHGDPRHFRGRPAGFWEYREGRAQLGQVVQALSNRLDAGRVLAYGETRLFRHSYRATMMEAYRHSALLLAAALRRAIEDTDLTMDCAGRNYGLPGNFTVARFCLLMAHTWCARILRAVFFRMHWEVAIAPRPEGPPDQWSGASLANAAGLPTPPGSQFLADPFWSADGETIYAESLDRRSGKGELVALDRGGGVLARFQGGGHMSYPSMLSLPEGELICPEIAGWSAPRLYRRDGATLADAGALDIAGGPRLLDPTMVEEDGTWFLFGNSKQLGKDALLLFTAPAPRGPWTPHPLSPVHIGPRGARMGGPILRSHGALWRWGQDNSEEYGAGLVLYRIERLTPQDYDEAEAGGLTLAGHKGPHTIDVHGERVVFDRYRLRFSPLAWLDRLKARL
jgi:hypothetical protein